MNRAELKPYSTIAVLLLLFLCYCSKNDTSAPAVPLFDSVPVVHRLVPLVNEISGIADSRINPGNLWAQEDGGNPPVLYLIGHNGMVAKSVYLKGITNRDWEEMALFDNEIYIAETGDNAQSYSGYAFYKFAEPSSAADTVQNIQTIGFRYPDGAHDAEAFLIDPASKNIYIITKRNDPSRVYRLSYPYDQPGNVAAFVGSLPYTGVTSAALSADGKEIIVKTYTRLFYYRRPSGSVEEALRGSYSSLPYTVEPQGEAVSFANDGSGFYTISEKARDSTVRLFFYKRH